MKEKFKKLLSIFLIAALVFVQVTPVFAEETPSPAPEEQVQVQDEPTQPDAPSESDSTRGSGRNDPENPGEPLGSGRNEPEPTPTPLASSEGETNNTQSTGGQNADGASGDPYITTGDAESTGNIMTNANSNLSTGSGNACCGGDISVVNDGNGANSSNTGSASVSENNTTDQTNSATIDNSLTGASITGQNSASSNTGGDSYITTGDANTSGTIITSANTNVDGVAISEFNIVDDHIGDYILDFSAGCISGCDGFSGSVQNLDNGANSDNDASLNSDLMNTTNQTNNADVNNDLFLTSDTGNNNASGNTGGDSYITTGDANVSGNVLTFLNNNIAGNVIYGVVNIFGDLIGDIILPESALNAFACTTCGGDTTLSNIGNGANSDNNVSSDQSFTDTINQVNVADIDNNLILEAYTGQNSTSGNTNGDNYITTGNASVNAQILNIANSNLIGSDWWLVIVNRAGQWIGQIVGAPQGSLFAGSQGTEFAVDENGAITASNNGNGENSTNNAAANQTVVNEINQNNNANVDNNIHLSANTGRNSANNNTGGDNYITSGDANVIANIVNYVNNNIAGGKLLVTFVNVFGNWMGNFITPGQQKLATELSVGGTQDNSSSNAQGGTDLSSTANSNTSSNSNGSSQGSGGSQTPSITIASGTFAQSNFSPAPQSNNSNTQIAGLSFTKPVVITQDSDKKTVNVNLAWFLLLIPLILAPLVYKLAKKIIFVINSARGRRGYV